MLSADGVRLHIEYQGWANRLIVGAAAQLSEEERGRDFGTADKSVLGTLVHVFAADRTWAARLERTVPPPFVTDADYRMAVLENEWTEVQERLRCWAAKLTDETSGAPLEYADLRGRRWEQPPWQIVLHLVNHGAHHRGQVAGFLRALGHTPPSLDLIRFYRERNPSV